MLGDFGADLVETGADGQRVVIQVKRYRACHSGSSGREGTSRSLPGPRYHQQRSYAQTLAVRVGVELWDRTQLVRELVANATH